MHVTINEIVFEMHEGTSERLCMTPQEKFGHLNIQILNTCEIPWKSSCIPSSRNSLEEEMEGMRPREGTRGILGASSSSECSRLSV